MSEFGVKEWVMIFKAGRSNVFQEARSRRSALLMLKWWRKLIEISSKNAT